ncbi:hypothetical protein KIS1582_1261 [Cytobacillus firmus]|uniref:Uncharacterized protein n=1 Tax=Cytobacillus firmus TaxID=1399 RepID=A0A800NBN2_CYTFI|nr:hypothetical protein KIS1582_1261 [Cytobacillus firmus]
MADENPGSNDRNTTASIRTILYKWVSSIAYQLGWYRGAPSSL